MRISSVSFIRHSTLISGLCSAPSFTAAYPSCADNQPTPGLLPGDGLPVMEHPGDGATIVVCAPSAQRKVHPEIDTEAGVQGFPDSIYAPHQDVIPLQRSEVGVE